LPTLWHSRRLRRAHALPTAALRCIFRHNARAHAHALPVGRVAYSIRTCTPGSALCVAVPKYLAMLVQATALPAAFRCTIRKGIFWAVGPFYHRQALYFRAPPRGAWRHSCAPSVPNHFWFWPDGGFALPVLLWLTSVKPFFCFRCVDRAERFGGRRGFYISYILAHRARPSCHSSNALNSLLLLFAFNSCFPFACVVLMCGLPVGQYP
jgi:hypothetical protein